MKPPDEGKKELVLQWVAKASQDFDLARHLFAEEQRYLEAICFHAQQAAEKYLKAYLTYHEVEFPKTHAIEKLLRLVGRIDRDLARSLDEASALSAYAIEVRYPDDLMQVGAEDAEQAVEYARLVREAILARLSLI
jgi:HEPN domain-containing protein